MRSRWAAVLLLLVVPVIEAQPPGGPANPYSLELQALKGPGGTDVIVKISPVLSGYDVPAIAKKIQLKAVDPSTNEAVWTQNFVNVGLVNGAATFTFGDLPRHMPIEAKVHVKTDQVVNEIVLTGATIVLMKPDLVIEYVEVPPSARENGMVDILVGVGERNGDLGATLHLSILEGDTVLDQAPGVVVPPGASVSTLFAVSFSQVGLHTLQALISGAVPAETNTDNNSQLFQILITGTGGPWRLSYRDTHFRSVCQAVSPDGTITQTDTTDVFDEILDFSSEWGGALPWPIASVTVGIKVDGEEKGPASITDLAPSHVKGGAGFTLETAPVFVPDLGSILIIETIKYEDGRPGTTTLEVIRSATQVVFMSENCIGRGCVPLVLPDPEGFLHARSSVELTATLVSDGMTLGTQGSTSQIFPTEVITVEPGPCYLSDWTGTTTTTLRNWTGAGAGTNP